MKSRKLIILLLVTLAVIIAAAITAKLRAPQSSIEKITLFPELASQINDVSRIVVKGNNQVVELKLMGQNWVISSSDNYPALFNKVRATVLNMADLKIVDEKTDNPDLYSHLGVEDPDVKDAQSLLITLYGSSNQERASLITGKPRQSSGSNPGLYVRKPDARTALLVEGVMDISADQTGWFERDLFDIPSDRVNKVTIHYPDGNEFEIFKDSPDQTDYTARGESDTDIAAISAARIIHQRLANGLQEMRADGVIARDNFTFPEDMITTTVTTFDGLVITAKLANVDEKYYGNFSFTVAPEKLSNTSETANTEPASENKPQNKEVDINELAASMNNALSGWVYQLPDFKYETLTTNLDSLKKDFQPLLEGKDVPP